MKTTLLVLFVFVLSIPLTAQEAVSQSIKGKIFDSQTGQPIPFANVIVSQGDYLTGTVSEMDGTFTIGDLPVGRYDVKATFIGFKDQVISDVIVRSHQPTILELSLEESPFDLGEVLIKPIVDKKQVNNEMANVSGRLLSVEEANRYAGGFDDPARLASAFAGVSSNIQSNGIVIRGNAPKYLQWKMEGVEIPNPNHFADLSAFGGGGLTALSSQVMDNTDFLTGAMPAAYQNALSGVFDLSMRNGHTGKHEHQVQVGIIGIDLASEGPFSRSGNASYLMNYRYSTLGLVQPLLPEEAGKINYQDLSFKLSFPSLKKGTIEWWGLGLHDYSGQDPVMDPANQFYEQDLLKQTVRQNMGATGLKYFKYLENRFKQIFRVHLAITGSNTALETQKLNSNHLLQNENSILNGQWNFNFLTELNSKFGKFHTNFSGLKFRTLHYNLGLEEADDNGQLQTIVNENGQSILGTIYSSSSFVISPRLNLITGLSLQYFSLNKEIIAEPRASLSYLLNNELKAGIGYGRHSRIEPLQYYFTRDHSGAALNNQLKLSKAHHLVGSLQWMPNENYMIKIEPYFQFLYDIPVSVESEISFINLENDWFLQEELNNSGYGRNMGIDLTFEKYMTRGFYGLFTFSVYDSKYRNQNNGPWINTRYNSNVIGNLLFGKEFNLGSGNHKKLGINYRMTYQAGSPYTPVNHDLSLSRNEIILDNSRPYSVRFAPSLVHHVTVNYLINRAKTSHTLSLKILNAGGAKEFESFRINTQLQQIEEYREALIIPNLSYKISF